MVPAGDDGGHRLMPKYRVVGSNINAASQLVTAWDLEPALDGWYAHEGVFQALAPHRIGSH